MKAFAMTSFGGNEVMKEINLEIPEPNENEVQVKIHYAGVNPIDWKTREGYMKNFYPHTFPMILGKDASGVVTKIGKNVQNFKVGDVVYSNTNKADRTVGAYAEYITLDENIVAHAPGNISLAEAASVPLVSLTAWQALFDTIQLVKGKAILIHGGAGAVGGIAIQLAKLYGATVYATANIAQHDFVKSIGADVVLNYEDANYSTLIKQDIDAAFDCAGGNSVGKSIEIVKSHGMVVTIVGGITEDLQQEANKKNIALKMMITTPNGDQLDKIKSAIEENKLRLSPIKEFAFGQIPEALTASQSGTLKGKAVISIA